MSTPRFAAGSAVALAAVLFASILTMWVTERWSVSLLEAGVLALAAVWSGLMVFRPDQVRGSFALVPLAGAVSIGVVQLMTGHTVNRWATWNAVLLWTVYLAAFFVALQVCSTPNLLVTFRRALLYFAFGLSVVSVLQFFTSPGKVYWLFQSGYRSKVLGPFVSPDQYAAFMELVFPIALFEALTDRRRTLLNTAITGTMFASVVAGASRAGSALLVLEGFAVLLLATVHGPGIRKLRPAFLSLLLFTLAFGSVVGWAKLWQRFQDPDPYKGRREMLESSIAMAREKPWTGFGLGSFEDVYRAYALFDAGTTVHHAHNDWAEWAAEGGMPFAALLLLLAMWSVPQAVRSIWASGWFPSSFTAWWISICNCRPSRPGHSFCWEGLPRRHTHPSP
jgi:O-antigen ligase